MFNIIFWGDGMLVKLFLNINKLRVINFKLNRGVVSFFLKCFELLEIVVNWKEIFKLIIF